MELELNNKRKTVNTSIQELDAQGQKSKPDYKALKLKEENYLGDLSSKVNTFSPQTIDFDAIGTTRTAKNYTKFSHIFSVAKPSVLPPTIISNIGFYALTFLPLIGLSWFWSFSKDKK